MRERETGRERAGREIERGRELVGRKRMEENEGERWMEVGGNDKRMER